VAERFVKKEKLPPQWAGLKFFNVFGPNEYHKGEMMSLVAKRFDDAKAGRTVRLFKSHREGIGDGEQRRDFIYVDDAVAMVRWLMETPQVSGIFNAGPASAELPGSDFGIVPCARPGTQDRIRRHAGKHSRQYQYFTEAKVDRLLARRLQRRLQTRSKMAQTLRHEIPQHRRPLSLKPGDHVRF